MTKRQARIEALEISYEVLTSLDYGMWDEGNIDEQEKILKEISNIAMTLHIRACKLRGEKK